MNYSNTNRANVPSCHLVFRHAATQARSDTASFALGCHRLSTIRQFDISFIKINKNSNYNYII